MSIVAVAKKAGVSVATVSRVLNKMDGVRPETVKQVRNAIRDIGYKPPRVKRGPKRGSRRKSESAFAKRQIAVLTVGAFQHWLGLPVMASVVAGVMRAAKELDVRAILDEMPDPDVPSAIIQRRQVDAAIVFFMSGLNPQILQQMARSIPLVWVMGSEDVQAQVDHVTADNGGAGQQAYHYLAQLGCQRLAFVTDHPDWPIVRLRAQAFANAAADRGQEVRNFLVAAESSSSHAYGDKTTYAANLDDVARSIANANPRPDGLFVPTDLLLTQIAPPLQKHGVTLERDIRVISCDNEPERLAQLNPRPASVDIRPEFIGRCAMRQLVHRLGHPDDPAIRILVAPQIALPAMSS